MNRIRWVATAALLLGACTGGGSKQSRSGTGAPWVLDRAERGAELEQKVARQSSGAQAGTIREVGGGRLVLDPYEPGAGETTLQLEEKTPVFRGSERESMAAAEALKPGMDVNVYFDRTKGTPRVLGVKILGSDEARELRTAVSRAPDRVESDRSAVEERFGGVSWQAGKIEEVRSDALVLDPYESAAGNATLKMEGEFDVYRGSERIGREALQPGDDVRVYFDERSGTPRVVGVEVLDDAEARRLREAHR